MAVPAAEKLAETVRALTTNPYAPDDGRCESCRQGHAYELYEITHLPCVDPEHCTCWLHGKPPPSEDAE